MTSDKTTALDERAHDELRMVEALLFAAGKPLAAADIAARLPDGADVEGHIETIRKFYSSRGVQLIHVGGKWMFRTAPDLSFLLREERAETRRLSRAGVETLAIIAYHQPVTRAEIEEMRGVGLSRGTLDILIEAGWVGPKGRRQTPGRPVTYGVTEDFLVHFGLESTMDLPGIAELKATGMLDGIEKIVARTERERGRAEREALKAARKAARESASADLEVDQEANQGEIEGNGRDDVAEAAPEAEVEEVAEVEEAAEAEEGATG